MELVHLQEVIALFLDFHLLPTETLKVGEQALEKTRLPSSRTFHEGKERLAGEVPVRWLHGRVLFPEPLWFVSVSGFSTKGCDFLCNLVFEEQMFLLRKPSWTPTRQSRSSKKMNR